jgi:Domain of unknown function (DUF4349)
MVTTVLAVSAILLSGCSLAGGSSSESAADAPAAQPQYEAGDSSGGFVDSGNRDAATDVVSGPQIITTVQLTVTVDHPIDAADDAAKIADQFGGTVADRSEQDATDRVAGSAQLTLRIPSAKLTQALDAIKALGIARNTSINSTDVTSQSEDLGARITALQTSVDRLLALLSKASSTDNLLAIENALSQRQADLESLQSQKRYLDDQVQLSTVNLYLISEKDTPAETPDTFWTGLIAGWGAFIGFWSAVLVAIGVLAPWLIAGGIIAAVVVTWVKLAGRRHAEKSDG